MQRSVVIAVVAATPYLALQLQAVVLSFSVFASAAPDGSRPLDSGQIAVWVAVGLAFFTILFGTRNLDARERQREVGGLASVRLNPE